MLTISHPVTGHPDSANGTTPAESVADDISSKIIVITPQMASELLTNRPANRPISKQRVRLMIEDLRSNRWVTNGESIILDSDLHLLDGQHRCMAVQESGISMTALVVIGVDQRSMPTIDSGRSKGAADVLYMHQTPHAVQLASTARWVWRYENQRMRQSAVLLRNDALPGYIAQHPGLPASMEWGKSLRGLLPQSPAAMLYYVMSQKEAALARRVFHGLATGLDVTAHDPTYQLRERLLKEPAPRTHLAVVSRCAVIVLVWTCLRKHVPWAPGKVWKGDKDPGIAFPEVV